MSRTVRDLYIETRAKMAQHGIPFRGGTIPIALVVEDDGSYTLALVDPSRL